MAELTDAQHLFITGLKNAHAMENQALAIMRPQVSRIEAYPEVKRMLETHIRETEGQLARLETLLKGQDTGGSMVKDAALSLAGTMAALGHTVAGDEILKNSFANFAFENFEIAAYRSLITMAEHAGETAAVMALQQNLGEEERMAALLEDQLPVITDKFISLREADAHAKN